MSGDRRCERSRRRVSGSAASVTSATAALRRTSSAFAAERLCSEYRASSTAAACSAARVSAAAPVRKRRASQVANCGAQPSSAAPQRTGELHAAVAHDAERPAVAYGRPAAAGTSGFSVEGGAAQRRFARRRCVDRRLAPGHALRVRLRRCAARVRRRKPRARRAKQHVAMQRTWPRACCVLRCGALRPPMRGACAAAASEPSKAKGSASAQGAAATRSASVGLCRFCGLGPPAASPARAASAVCGDGGRRLPTPAPSAAQGVAVAAP